jgi:hypothetical protein
MQPNSNTISYRIPDSQRGYQAPTPPPVFRAPEVAAAAARTEGTVAQQAHAAIVHGQNEFRKHIEATDRIRGNFTDAGYQAQITAFQNTSAAKSVDSALESVTARRDAAAANVAQVRKSLSPNGDVASELRATRYRDRVVRTLDAKDRGQLFTAARELLAEASREELGVLLVELPPYLQSRGSTSDWIDAEVGRIVPEYGAAQSQLNRAEQAQQIVRQNAQFARNAFATGRPATVFVPYDAAYDPDA